MRQSTTIGQIQEQFEIPIKPGVYVIPLFHTGHESPESPRIDFFWIRGDL